MSPLQKRWLVMVWAVRAMIVIAALALLFT